MVVGSDRVSDFNTLLNRYNGEDVKHGFYQFDEIKVVSAGERDPDAEGVEGMSASKMRAAVADGNYDVFKMGIPASVSEKDCKKLYYTVAKGMGITIEEGHAIDEDAKMARQTDSQLRKLLQKASAMDQSSPANKSFTQRIKKELKKRGLAEYVTLGDVLDKIVEDAEQDELDEALTPAQRRKMAMRMKIQAKRPGFIRKREISMKKAATKGKLDSRARKTAINMVIKRFFPKLKKKSRSDLSYAERGKISDIVKKKSKVIARFAKRLVKDKRKQDVERRRNRNKKKD